MCTRVLAFTYTHYAYTYTYVYTYTGALLWRVGPRGPDFAKYSIAYHYARNLLHVRRAWGLSRAEQVCV